MSKYNRKTVGAPEVATHQGGVGVQLSPELEMVSLLVTGLNGQFYEKESEREARLVTLIREVGKKNPELVAKALVYTRSVVGQRSVTHVGAVAALPVLKGTPLATKFFSKRSRKANMGGIVFRLDDMLEILSYYFLRNPGKPLPNAMRRGFKKALEAADTFEIARYQGKGKEVSLVDIVNLVRPKPSARMEETFKLLKSGKLKVQNTAEDKQSEAGQKVAEKVRTGEITKAQAEVELQEAKAENWAELIGSGAIGYLALLRNLRNIVMVASADTFNKALELLTDEGRIRKSLVFPHQIDLAMEVLLGTDSVPQARRTKLIAAVDKAYTLAIPNLTELFSNGRTAVVVDTSGSMTSPCTISTASGKGSRVRASSALDKGALIAATLAKGIGADLYHFSDNCEKLNYNPVDSVNSIKNYVISKSYASGTYFDSIFRTLAEKSYDRIFVVSDMQGADDILRGSSFQSYIKKHGRPYIYSVDLTGYGTSMFRQSDRLIQLFGYSSDIYEMVKTSEISPKAILAEIEKIKL